MDMPEIFGRSYTKRELLRRAGHLGQIAGVERVQLQTGLSAGVEAVDVRTGGGLEYTVLPGRGMDIGAASYQGVPLAWLGATGVTHPSYYEPAGLGWLRGFHGGLLTGCGLTQIGPPGEDGGQSLGLHGRLSNTPAEAVSADGEWRGEEYEITVKGRVREAAVFGEQICLRRIIRSALGGRSIAIEDEVENEGWQPCPHMMLYHVNLGFPLLDEGGAVVAPSLGVTPRDDEARAGLDGWNRIPRPVQGLREQVFFHTLAGDEGGRTFAALINRGLGLGVRISFNLRDLPNFVQWKMPGEGEYVLGLEPANCLLSGRAGERRAGRLASLEPGEIARHRLEIKVLVGEELAETELEAENRSSQRCF